MSLDHVIFSLFLKFSSRLFVSFFPNFLQKIYIIFSSNSLYSTCVDACLRCQSDNKQEECVGKTVYVVEHSNRLGLAN